MTRIRTTTAARSYHLQSGSALDHRRNQDNVKNTTSNAQKGSKGGTLAKSGALALAVTLGAISIGMAPASAAGCNVSANNPTSSNSVISGRSYRGDSCTNATTLSSRIRRERTGPDETVATASKTVTNNSVTAQYAFRTGKYRTRANTSDGVQVESSWVTF